MNLRLNRLLDFFRNRSSARQEHKFFRQYLGAGIALQKLLGKKTDRHGDEFLQALAWLTVLEERCVERQIAPVRIGAFEPNLSIFRLSDGLRPIRHAHEFAMGNYSGDVKNANAKQLAGKISEPGEEYGV